MLLGYWNQVGDLIEDAVAPDAPPDARVIDLWLEDFPEDAGLTMAAASFDWATGFMRATTLWPEAWGDRLTGPDLASHWEIIRWWSLLPDKTSLEQIAAAAKTQPPRTLASAVTALARALRSGPRPMF